MFVQKARGGINKTKEQRDVVTMVTVYKFKIYALIFARTELRSYIYARRNIVESLIAVFIVAATVHAHEKRRISTKMYPRVYEMSIVTGNYAHVVRKRVRKT